MLDGWTTVARARDVVDGKPIRVEAGSVEVFLYRSGDRWFALANRCSHQGGPLHKGRVTGGGQPTVTCPVHGSMFWLADGRVVRGPATAPQPVFDVRETDGMIEVRPRTVAGAVG